MIPVGIEHRDDGVTVLSPAGRLTIGPSLAALAEAIEETCREAVPRVVLDLGGVTYVDSAALGEIVAARRRVLAAGGAFAVARPRGKVRDLLDLTRLGDLVVVRESLRDAARAVLPSC